MDRPKELKEIFARGLDAGEIRVKVEDEKQWTSAERREELEDRYQREQPHIAELEERIRLLTERCEVMTDAEFDAEFDAIDTELTTATEKITYYKECDDYTEQCVDIRTIQSLEQFIENFPMHFVPRKEEIGRILAVAKEMHDQRVLRLEISATDPIDIVDIGGGNGALGRLVIDLARENNLPIRYTVVDPDVSITSKAKKTYADEPDMHFIEKDAGTFNREQSADDPVLVDKLQEREALIQEGKRRRKYFESVLSEIDKKLEEGSFDESAMRTYQQMVKHGFDIDVPDAIMSGASSKMLQWLSSKYKDNESRKSADVGGATYEIEERQSFESDSRRCDLVINAWMPCQVDFTKDVREADGAAIIYALARSHDSVTGIANGDLKRFGGFGAEESYISGERYHMHAGWLGHSFNEVDTLLNVEKHGRLHKLWENRGGVTTTFANAFIVQIRDRYNHSKVMADPGSSGILINGAYPWEEGLLARGSGEIMPIVDISEYTICDFPQARDVERESYSEVKVVKTLFKNIADNREEQEKGEDSSEPVYWRAPSSSLWTK